MTRDEAREVLTRAFDAAADVPPGWAALLAQLTEQAVTPPPKRSRRR